MADCGNDQLRLRWYGAHVQTATSLVPRSQDLILDSLVIDHKWLHKGVVTYMLPVEALEYWHQNPVHLPNPITLGYPKFN